MSRTPVCAWRRRDRLKIITQRIDALVAEARHMDIDLSELIELLRQRDKVMQTQSVED